MCRKNVGLSGCGVRDRVRIRQEWRNNWLRLCRLGGDSHVTPLVRGVVLPVRRIWYQSAAPGWGSVPAGPRRKRCLYRCPGCSRLSPGLSAPRVRGRRSIDQLRRVMTPTCGATLGCLAEIAAEQGSLNDALALLERAARTSRDKQSRPHPSPGRASPKSAVLHTASQRRRRV
jgi:hypothetical protein